ncbi:MAG: glutamate--tRNA ligase [Caldisericia bacterium]|nr:glutamate--tRNA ligase [Caldisericia bacterium]
MRLRFAPSPTGALHVGSARIAIVNYLIALHYQADMILRIEDTDQERSTKESLDNILQTLQWLGISFQEGPYFQSQRTSLYQDYVARLLRENKAYRCFCSVQDMETMKEKQIACHEAPGYDGRCSTLSNDTVQEYLSEGKPYVVRLRVPKEPIVFEDLIKGSVVFDGTLIPDFVIVRQDGSPTYQLAVVVDDYEMGITHVVRGEDHVSNTPKQIALYQSLELPIPAFAHIPLIIGSDRSKLSKRHGDTSIQAYREKGYLPQALVNYFALLGSSHDSQQEILSLQQIAHNFSFEHLSKSPSMFDINKLTWMNHLYIQQLSTDQYRKDLQPFLKNIPLDCSTIEKIATLSQMQLKTLQSIQEVCEPFHTFYVDWSDKHVQKLIHKPCLISLLQQFMQVLKESTLFSIASLESKFDPLFQAQNVKKRDAIQIVRLAVTGKLISPPLFDTLYLLGQQKSIERMNQFLQEVSCQRQESLMENETKNIDGKVFSSG